MSMDDIASSYMQTFVIYTDIFMYAKLDLHSFEH